MGTLVREHGLRAFDVAECDYTPNQRLGRHAHRPHSLTVVREGRFRERAGGGRVFDGAPGTVLFTPAAHEHANEAGREGARTLVAELALCPESISELRLPDRACALAGAGVAGLTRGIERELVAGDPASAIALEGLLLEIVACVIRSGSSRPERARPAWLSRVLELLHDRFLDRLELAEVAAVAGVHPVHLARAFRRHVGCTVGAYQRRLRLDRAAAELAGTDEPIALVARRCAYADQAHFSRAFKRHSGQTPAQYRRSRRAR